MGSERDGGYLDGVRWFAVKNTSGVNIPPFGCMQLLRHATPPFPRSSRVRNVVLPSADKPNAPFVIIGSRGLPAGQSGKATVDLPCTAMFDGTDDEFVPGNLVYAKAGSPLLVHDSANALKTFQTSDKVINEDDFDTSHHSRIEVFSVGGSQCSAELRLMVFGAPTGGKLILSVTVNAVTEDIEITIPATPAVIKAALEGHSEIELDNLIIRSSISSEVGLPQAEISIAAANGFTLDDLIIGSIGNLGASEMTGGAHRPYTIWRRCCA